MSGHCPKCGDYTEEDDSRLCSGCLGNPFQCPSLHYWSGGLRCVLAVGHDGRCCGPMRNNGNGSATRTWWYSENGKFKSHDHYETKYFSNASQEPRQ